MDDQMRAWLKDIQQAILEIQTFIPDQKNFYLFEKDVKTKRAVERNIEIIGEAMARILKANPTIQISETRKIVDTRNRIIHGYDSVSAEILWGIVIKNLPSLQNEVTKLLETE
jgi:uncharacterized protein with HEPN domain